MGADRLRVLQAALCLTTFLVSSTGLSLAPFYLDIARELATDLAAVVNLQAWLSLTWSAVSLIAGAVSDRLGRRPVLALALLVLAAALSLVSRAESYLLLVACMLMAGSGAGSYMGAVFATVADHVAPSQRGRALGWVITGQSLSLVLGVPLMTALGAVVGWRGAVQTQSAAVLVAAAVVWLVVPPRPTAARSTPAVPAVGGAPGGFRAALSRPVVALLAAGAMERACFASYAIYLAAYLQTSYGVGFGELAVGLSLVAAGNLIGNTVGSFLADRLPARQLQFAGAATVTGFLALPLLLWQPGVTISLALGFVYALSNAVGRPALLASLSGASTSARGAILGLNVTTSGVGWLTATAIGGSLVARFGFGSLGLLCCATALVGAAFAVGSWTLARAALPPPAVPDPRGAR